MAGYCVTKFIPETQMIAEAEKRLSDFQRQANNGFLQGMGYTEQEIKDNLDLLEKSVALHKGEIPYETYSEAYKKVYGKKVV